MSNSTIEFDYHLNPGQDKDTKEPHYHARIVNGRIFDRQDVIDRLSRETTVTNVDIVAVLEGVRQILVDELSCGNMVSLDGIGRFDPILTMTEGECTGKERGKLLTLKSVKFCPQRSLVKEIRSQLKPLSRRKTKHSADMSEIELYGQLTDYFKTHDSISRKEMEENFHLTHYKAIKFINMFVGEERLLHPGNRNDSRYIPAPGFFGKTRNR